MANIDHCANIIFAQILKEHYYISFFKKISLKKVNASMQAHLFKLLRNPTFLDMCCPKYLYDNCCNSLKNGSIPLTFCTLKAPTALPPPKYVAG